MADDEDVLSTWGKYFKDPIEWRDSKWKQRVPRSRKYNMVQAPTFKEVTEMLEGEIKVLEMMG